jgi:hypothetical protein
MIRPSPTWISPGTVPAAPCSSRTCRLRAPAGHARRTRLSSASQARGGSRQSEAVGTQAGHPRGALPPSPRASANRPRSATPPVTVQPSMRVTPDRAGTTLWAWDQPHINGGHACRPVSPGGARSCRRSGCACSRAIGRASRRCRAMCGSICRGTCGTRRLANSSSGNNPDDPRRMTTVVRTSVCRWRF